MQVCSNQVLVAALACLVLGGCETSTKLGDLISLSKSEEATGSVVETPAPGAPATTGSVTVAAPSGPASGPGLLGSDPNDDLSLGKKHFRAANYGLAERHFRRAVELHPNDAESWIGLAASYDRLRRFELADRAYRQAIEIIGPTPEVLNNQGYSYILRGDYPRARAKLAEARALDPKNPFVLNNIRLLEESSRKGKAVQ